MNFIQCQAVREDSAPRCSLPSGSRVSFHIPLLVKAKSVFSPNGWEACLTQPSSGSFLRYWTRHLACPEQKAKWLVRVHGHTVWRPYGILKYLDHCQLRKLLPLWGACDDQEERRCLTRGACSCRIYCYCWVAWWDHPVFILFIPDIWLTCPWLSLQAMSSWLRKFVSVNLKGFEYRTCVLGSIAEWKKHRSAS